MKHFGLLPLIALVALVATSPVSAQQVYDSQSGPLRVVTVAEGLNYPWGLGFLPSGQMIVTEREGAMRLVSADGQVGAPLAGLPDIWVNGQGGVLDVLVDPKFTANQTIFFSYAEPGAGGGSTAVARAKLDIAGNQLTDVQVIYSMVPKSSGGRHFGSRLVMGTEGHLFITTGDRGERDRNQDFTINRGQVVRIWPDGAIPDDNPYVGQTGYRPEVWSYGHRNPQGAARHPVTGKLWLHEHGARGGDEINIPEAGKNYGWPVIAYGRHYWGGKIGEGNAKPGLEQPIYYWVPSIAPSGMAFYTGDKFPAWQGNLFVGALKERLLVRLELDGESVVGEERLFEAMDERIRDVRQGPDGYLYLLTDDDVGTILRIEPGR